MKKRLFTLLTFVCATAAAFSFVACGSNGGENEGGNGGGGENPPQVELKDSDAPVSILYNYDTTAIYVTYAVYNAEGTTSPYSEYKLDEGEWQLAKKTSRFPYSDAVFENLTPGSIHTLYARCAAHDDYKASTAYSVSVTLDKAYCNESLETADYEVTGKTLTVTLGDDLEVSFDNRNSWTTEGTHTYSETGEKTFYLRYRETATHYAGTSMGFTAMITDFAGGAGTQENPYLIDTLEQFKALRTATYLHKNDWIKLTSDIEFDNEPWDGLLFDEALNIDGDGHKLVAPQLNKPLFDTLGTAKNLTVERAVYAADLPDIEAYAALLTMWIQWAENVSVSGTITISCGEKLNYFRDYSVSVGGLAVFLQQPWGGGAYGMKGCSADISITLPDTTSWGENYSLALGGLAATVTRSSQSSDAAEISACAVNMSATGGVIIYGDIGGLVGGLIASNESGPSGREASPVSVRDCYTGGSVSLKAVCHVLFSEDKYVTRIGGIAPAVSGGIRNCYSTLAFDIMADIYRNSVQDSQAEILIGGIVMEGAYEGMTAPKLSSVFFAGSITVKNIADESKKGGIFSNSVVCVRPSDFDSPSGLFYDESALVLTAGEGQVTGSALETAVSSNDLCSPNWQKSNLNWDETVWTLQDGKLPVLK